MVSAFYDPVKDEIVGAKVGSFAWFHESRHREQYVSGWAVRADILHIYCYYSAFFACVLGFFLLGYLGLLVGIGACMLPHVLSLALLELDAYVVGTFRWLRK